MKLLRNNAKAITIPCIMTEMLNMLEITSMLASQFQNFAMLKHTDSTYCNNQQLPDILLF